MSRSSIITDLDFLCFEAVETQRQQSDFKTCLQNSSKEGVKKTEVSSLMLHLHQLKKINQLFM